MRPALAQIFRWLERLTAHRLFPLGCGALVFLLSLGLAWLVLEPGALWSPDEGAKLLQLRSLRLQDGRLDLGIVYTSQGMDPEFHYALINPVKDVLTVQDGALMLRRLPLFTLLSLPFYRLLGMHGLYLLPALCGGLTVWLTLSLVRAADRRLSMALLAGLGSPVLIYSVLFWEHTLAAALGLAAAWLMLEDGHAGVPPPRSARWVLAAGLLALGVYLRLEVLIFALALAAAAWLCLPGRRRHVARTTLLLGLCLLPYPFLHQALFANQSLPMNAQHLNLPMAYLGQTGWLAVQDLLIGPTTDEAIRSGWLGALWSVLAVLGLGLSLLSGRYPRLRGWTYTALAASLLPAAYFLLTPTPYRAAHGLLFSTPWALLGLSRLPETWREPDPRLRTLSLTVVLGLAGYTLVMLVFRASSPHGGLEWGARFALLFYPLLAILAGWQMAHTRRDLLLLGLFVILGIGFQVRGVATIYHDKQVSQASNQVLLSAPEVQVVSDLWWLPLNAAPLYPQKAFFLAVDAASMTEWLDQACSAGFGEVLLVTLDAGLPGSLADHLERCTLNITGDEIVEHLHHMHLELGTP
jgi:hypothetical protein